MTRTLLLTVTLIGILPAVLLAAGSLFAEVGSVLFRPFSLSLRLNLPGGRSFDVIPALHLSPSTSLLIIFGSAFLVAGILRIQPEQAPGQTLPPTSSSQ